MDSGSVAWMLTASALVLFMTPGLAFFYGGLARSRNVVNTIMLSFMSMAVVSVVWVLWGYSLAFGPGNALVGDLSLLGLSGIELDDGGEIPELLVVIFQMMFAIITPALITGAVVERFKFTTYLVFLVIWVTVVYAPIAHWVWAGEGWLFKAGALDFAGGTVVHINAGVAAVAAALLLGKRRKLGGEPGNVPSSRCRQASNRVAWPTVVEPGAASGGPPFQKSGPVEDPINVGEQRQRQFK